MFLVLFYPNLMSSQLLCFQFRIGSSTEDVGRTPVANKTHTPTRAFHTWMQRSPSLFARVGPLHTSSTPGPEFQTLGFASMRNAGRMELGGSMR